MGLRRRYGHNHSVKVVSIAVFIGADNFIIANADTVMTRSSADLMQDVYPDVPVHGKLEDRQTLLSIEKAKRVLGYEPEHNWQGGEG